jgi:hypothetical protein
MTIVFTNGELLFMLGLFPCYNAFPFKGKIKTKQGIVNGG